jgi:DnaJ domain
MSIRPGAFVISSNIELRGDGLPRSSSRAPEDSGVAVYWTRKGKQQVMAIDIYDRVQDNMAAIAASLSALRAIERHGGAQILERAFAGFDALPNPNRFDCWAVLGLKPGADAEAINSAFRRLAREHHPDTENGNTDQFQRLERARREALRQ